MLKFYPKMQSVNSIVCTPDLMLNYSGITPLRSNKKNIYIPDLLPSAFCRVGTDSCVSYSRYSSVMEGL